MSERTFSTRSRFSVGALLCGMTALPFVMLAIFNRDAIFLSGAVLPGLLGYFLWQAAGRQLTFSLTSEQLELKQPALAIPYQQMQQVWRSDRGKRADRLLIATRDVIVELPPVDGISLDDLEDWLLENLTPPPRPQPHPDMEAFVQEQLALFGDDKVLIYRARPAVSSKRVGRRMTRRQAWAYALLLGGLIMIVAGAVNQGRWAPVAGFGVLSLLLGAIVWLIVRPRHKVHGDIVSSKLKDSCLVLSPRGIALIQGDLRGTLAWEEVLGVNRVGNYRSFQISSPGRGISLKVRGADILLLDIYDSPIDAVEVQIQRHLHGS